MIMNSSVNWLPDLVFLDIETTGGAHLFDRITEVVLISALSLPIATFAAEGDSAGTKVSDSIVTAKV
jgi:hypothetical protein